MLPLLDTHQHLILPDRLGYRWTERVEVLRGRTFGPDAYAEAAAGLGIAATLCMEADADDGEAEAAVVAGVVSAPGSRMLGQIAACRPETDVGFEAWLDRAAGLGIVGFRRILHEVPDEVSQAPIFRANLRRIGARGLPFDLVMLARQLPLARDLARACPETLFVLDHCGVPDIAGGDLAGWRAAIAGLAAEPNLVAKISGILAYCAPGQADAAAVRPVIEHVVACFGPDRCLWGSDWPVLLTRADLAAWVAITRDVLATLTADEAAAIAHRTAARVYDVGLPALAGNPPSAQ